MVIKNKSFACLDMVLFLIAPIIQILWFLLGSFLTVYELYDTSLTSLIDYIISYRLLFLLLTYIGSIAIAIYVTKYSKKSVLGTISGIITFPLFITTWIPINITCLFRKNINWIQIKHSRNVELDILTK